MTRVPGRQRRARIQIEATGIAALCCLTAAAYALVQSSGPYPLTMLFPPAGAAFGYLVLRGPRGMPASAAAMVLGTAIGLPVPFTERPFACIAEVIVLTTVLSICSHPLHQVWRQRTLSTPVFGVLTLFVVTGLVAAPLGAAAGTYLVAAGFGEHVGTYALTRLFLGVATGVATLAPATIIGALQILGADPAILHRPVPARGEVLVPAIAIVSPPALALALPGASGTELWLLPLAMIPLLWISVSGRLLSTAFSIAASALVLGSMTIGLDGEGEALYRAQIVLLASAVATLYLGASSLRLAAQRLHQEAADSRWRALVAAAPATVTRIGADGTTDDASQPALHRTDVQAAISARIGLTTRWQSAAEATQPVRNFVTQVTPLPDGETLVVTTESTLVDAAEAALAWERTHDRASGLPNRDLLLATTASVVAAGNPAFLLVIDTDHLMRRSLLLGADGSAVIRALARRIDQSLRLVGGDEVLLARTGDDQLAVLTQQTVDAGSEPAERLLTAANTALTVDGLRIPVTASIGMAPVQHQLDVSNALRLAEVAAQTSREQGRAGIVRADASAGRTAADQARLGAEVLAAVERGELDVVYQPDVDPADGAVRGLEALVRWHRREGYAVATEDFVRTAEGVGAVAGIDEWVMRTALTQLGLWRREFGITTVELGINVSVRSLTADLPGRLDAECRRNDVPPGLIRLEVTETALGDDSEAISVLREARARGFRVALDDFGTGYASLSRLRQLPVDVIKLDRSFLGSLADDTATQTLVAMVLGLAEPLHLDVVVEGVETEAQRDVLVRLGCERAQGFLFAPPAQVAALQEILLDDRAVPAG